jgi:hypothetical protein
MADNRIWLVYRPTGDAICLGKRFDESWYYGNPNSTELLRKLDRFFDRAYISHMEDVTTNEKDDFCLCAETWGGLGPQPPYIITDCYFDVSDPSRPRVRFPRGARDG